MGLRLEGFDYSRPYYYMVTLKCRRGTTPLSAIVAPGRCEMSAITRAFVNCIRHFHEGCRALAPIECFSIMPDHIHLLLHLVATAAPLRLEVIVAQVMGALEGRYQSVTGKRESVFSTDWHDWIVARAGQLTAFTRYIRENPARHWLRKTHPEYFTQVRNIQFLDRTWYGYGNPDLLKLPVLEVFRCSRRWVEGGPEWRAAVARAARVGAGGVGIGTFMSPCEKACGHGIGLAGGAWVVLSPEGFGPRWHPGRISERFCAEGRMLFLSLYPAQARQPTAAELYQRCHEMGDVVVAGAPCLQRAGKAEAAEGLGAAVVVEVDDRAAGLR